MTIPPPDFDQAEDFRVLDLVDELQILFGRFGGNDPPVPTLLPNGEDLSPLGILYCAWNRVYKEHPEWFVGL